MPVPAGGSAQLPLADDIPSAAPSPPLGAAAACAWSAAQLVAAEDC